MEREITSSSPDTSNLGSEIRVLDIGCGPADILMEMPGVDYVGFDIDPKLIEAARKKHGNKGRFFCAPANEQAISSLERFDLVLATGVIHHLSDEEALGLFRLAQNTLKSGRPADHVGLLLCRRAIGIFRFLMQGIAGQFVRTLPIRRSCRASISGG